LKRVPGISLSLLEACSFQGNNPVLVKDVAHILSSLRIYSVASHSLLTPEYLGKLNPTFLVLKPYKML